mmetsp:Transcript_44891/g.81921  ORF Transcript_44891/g.81921 Transcript_44891/m.81921 type:complete len:206 (-) Transcript_44891:28-645(-)
MPNAPCCPREAACRYLWPPENGYEGTGWLPGTAGPLLTQSTSGAAASWHPHHSACARCGRADAFSGRILLGPSSLLPLPRCTCTRRRDSTPCSSICSDRSLGAVPLRTHPMPSCSPHCESSNMPTTAASAAVPRGPSSQTQATSQPLRSRNCQGTPRGLVWTLQHVSQAQPSGQHLSFSSALLMPIQVESCFKAKQASPAADPLP